MSQDVPTEHFVRELTRSQNAVFSYILSLVTDPDAARDILQDTNVVLWRKAGEFTEGTRFMSWALAVARLQVLTFMRDHRRDRHVFDVQVVTQMADEYAANTEDADDRARVFEDCLKLLPPGQRELVSQRYAAGGSVKAIAQSRGQSPGAISVTLSRIRKALANCMAAKIAEASQS